MNWVRLAAEIDAKILEEVRKKYPMDNDEKQRIAHELKRLIRNDLRL